MSSLISLKPSSNNFDSYLKDINSGLLQIPEFQRDFVWGLENVLNLLNSIKKNYPIGSFLFWTPETEFRIAKQVGPYFLKDSYLEDFEHRQRKYILDGYQRMSTLFGVLSNPEDIENFTINTELYNSTFNINYNLESEVFEVNLRNLETFSVPAYTLLDYESFLTHSEKIQREYNSEQSKIYTTRLKRIVTTFTKYQMPVIEIAGGTLDEAIDIFTLLNKEGKPITPDWILSAKTYTDNFRLGDKIDNIVEKIDKYNFIDKKPREVAVRDLIFRSIQSSFGDLYLDNKRTDIIALSKKENFQAQVDITVKSIELVAKFLFEELLIVDNKLLPANIQFIFLVEFFNHVPNPNQKQIEKLKLWFWVTTYSNYFTIFSPSKRKTAFQHFQRFIYEVDINPVYHEVNNHIFDVPILPEKVNLGSVRSKAHILFMLNYSNNFERVDVEYVVDYKILKLFSETEVPFYLKESANMVVCLNTTTNSIFIYEGKKKSDLSFMLHQENRGKYLEYFITDEMRDNYSKGNIIRVLELRYHLIYTKERDFVDKFDLEYQEKYELF
ncbi:DUF262 domain-containing protein [Arcicella sp. DC2W]|uniref:DUF262 domain-containing protein n=1 Tax=Arcicella gelida TaxID=2984195 RepID=A0ABU5S2L2_9BACT|nr:DUF262 domain-containing protein [Arcicella sp. DC2W]MEA5402641.1 DUF262 domain-containing protein [Arcicella sp. DC2W]